MKKNNILTYLFVCIIINIIPTAMLKVLEIPNKIYVIANAICYALIILIMLHAVRKEIKKVPNKKIILLITFVLLQIIVQIVNYFCQGSIQFLDIVNILSVTINIFIFIICVSYSNVEKEDIQEFMKKMVLLGLVACLYNIIINGMQMLNIAKLTNSYIANFSSFFPNRNQFGSFIVTILLANLYIKQENKKNFYKLAEIIFIINLVLTMSRTAIIGMIFMYIIKFCLDYFYIKKISKNRFIFITFMIMILIVVMIFVFTSERYIKLIDKLFIRSENIQTGYGRTTVWKNGIDMILNGNYLLGLGRFNAVNLNKTVYNSHLEYFHSIYIETFVTYGIVGIIFLFLLFKYIIKRISKSSLDRVYKNIFITYVGVFMIISIFETTTRFSIGYADIMNMIWFITVPIIVSSKNSMYISKK